MRIGVVTSVVPFVHGGARFIADWLGEALREHGHDVEIVKIPSSDDPNLLLRQMAAFQAIKLDEYYDRVITLRPPAHLVRHPSKFVWFIHHVRYLYDHWGTDFSPVPDRPYWRGLRDQVVAMDNLALADARRLFSNSQVVADRLKRYNGLSAEVLYPPVSRPERFVSKQYGDEIVCVCRMEQHKRQHLLVDAMAHTRSGVRLRLCGKSWSRSYVDALRATVERLDLADRVAIDATWIDEAEKIDIFAHALANAYVPLDEDSYGFPTLEAAHARRCTITVADSGGVLEFVRSDLNGIVVPPEPAALAQAFDRLWNDRALARDLGHAAHDEVGRLGISWERVAERFLA